MKTQPADAAGAVPDLSRLLVLMDYDGTVTTHECNEIVFQRLTGNAWRRFEDAVRRGVMGHAECLDRQVGLVDVPRDRFFAANVEVAEPAPGLRRFLEGAVATAARVTIVSAGYREAIEMVWRREDLPPVAIYASEVAGAGAGGGPPYRMVYDPVLGDCPSCGPGGCKGGALRALKEVGDAVAVFGDGVSDLCMARAADIVFAKGTLARLCAAESIPHLALGDYDRAWSDLVAWYPRWRPR